MSTDEDFRDHVLAHFESPYHRGACTRTTHRYRARNDPCGDEVEIELWIEGDMVREVWFTGRGCVISQAAASMLVETLEGRTLEAARSYTTQEMLKLFAAPLAPARWRCGPIPSKAVVSPSCSDSFVAMHHDSQRTPLDSSTSRMHDREDDL